MEMSMKNLIFAITASVAAVASSESVAAKKPRELPRLEIILENKDLIKVQDIVPTSYWIVKEGGFPCAGDYNKRSYSGNEKAKIMDRNGNVIDTVCGRFYAALVMEGTGIIDRNGTPITINYDGLKDGNVIFKEVIECKYGVGVNSKCLLPFYSVAADLSPKTKNHWNEGDIAYVPQMKGVILLDGSRHQGFFVVRDTGGRFYGHGRVDRLDFFAGESKNSKFWDERGFNHTKRFAAYKVEGESKARAHTWLQQKFGDLYSARAR